MTKNSELPLISLPEVLIKYKNFSLKIEALNLKKGEVLGIFGKSGAGKTSYLKKIREAFPSKEVYYMSQFDCLFEGITIRQNIELGLACADKPRGFFNGWEKRYAELLKEFEVDRHLHKYPKALSGGQRKRVELVRTLMMDPKILLLDEPFTGIGHLFEASATKYLIMMAENKTNITLCVSHDFDLLSKFSNKILLVDEAGVIETIPIGDSAWSIKNLRTATTLGLENILSSSRAESLSGQKLSNKNSIGFFAADAAWHHGPKPQSEDTLSLSIHPSKIVNKRSYFKEGGIYARIHLELDEQKEPLVLVGKGTINENPEELYLGIRHFYYLN